MPERKAVSPSQLNVWLTAQMLAVEGCRNCELTWKYRLREPEKHGGCNWSDLNLRYGEGTDNDTVVKAAWKIEREAFIQFNLEPESSPPPRAAPEFMANMLPRLLMVPTFRLDPNLVNARQKLDAVDCMEHWRETGVILLVMAGIAHEEAPAGTGGIAETRKRRAAGHIYTINDDGDVTDFLQKRASTGRVTGSIYSSFEICNC